MYKKGSENRKCKISGAVCGFSSGNIRKRPKGSRTPATVTVKSLETGATRVLTTNENGKYQARSLPLGPQEIKVEKAGFKLEVDVSPSPTMRVVQLTPPGSACSIVIGVGISDPHAAPVQGIHLVVDDIVATRDSLMHRGVDVSEVSDVGGGVKYAYFADPDGNSWALQEITR